MTAQRLELAAWVLGAIGIVGCGIGWWLNVHLFAPAWLAAIALWLGWPLGSMALLLIHPLTGGRWGGPLLRPPLIAGMLTLPLICLAVIPLIFVMHPLYAWTGGDVPNARYLNIPFWWGRVGGYIALWLLLAAFIMLALPRAEPERPLRVLAPPALALLFVSATLAAIDLILSLYPRYNSAAFGMVMSAEWTLFAMAIAVFWVALFEPAYSITLDPMGKMLLMLVVLWGYLVFVEFLIVWNSDLAIDAPWYVNRAERGWGIVAYFLFVFHFAVPAVLLPFPAVRRSRVCMLAICGMLIGMQVPRAWWLVVPDAQRSLSWVDVCAMFVLIGIPLGLALRGFRLPYMKPMVPGHA